MTFSHFYMLTKGNNFFCAKKLVKKSECNVHQSDALLNETREIRRYIKLHRFMFDFLGNHDYKQCSS